MTISLPFEQQFTWRKLGYLYFGNSLDYRQVLEQNPQWTVTELPPVGAQLQIDSSYTDEGFSGGLTQGDFVFTENLEDDTEDYFPFYTEASYDEALDKYTLQGVVEREAINGINFDSVQAITGVQ
jgi:hypothetical protein